MVCLFNGVSAFVGYLMPKPFMMKNSCDIFEIMIGVGVRSRFVAFPKVQVLKVNVIA